MGGGGGGTIGLVSRNTQLESNSSMYVFIKGGCLILWRHAYSGVNLGWGGTRGCTLPLVKGGGVTLIRF